MILDSLLQFDAANNLAQVAGTYNSTNVLDLHIINGGLPVLANLQGARDIGIGDDPALKLLVLVTVAFASGGAGTLQVNFQGATDNGAGAPAAFSTYYSTPAYALATLVAGARLMDMDVPRPPAGVAVPRYLRLTYVIGTATMTAGTVEAFIVLDRMDQMYQSTSNAVMGGYPAGITVAN
jgi:hypothetical protein